jgi:hypothetical protein
MIFNDVRTCRILRRYDEDFRVINKVVEDLVAAGQVRAVVMDMATQNSMSGKSVQHTVLFDPGFPEPTEVGAVQPLISVDPHLESAAWFQAFNP